MFYDPHLINKMPPFEPVTKIVSAMDFQKIYIMVLFSVEFFGTEGFYPIRFNR